MNSTGVCIMLLDRTAPKSQATGEGAGIGLAETWSLASDALGWARKLDVETKGDWNCGGLCGG